MSEFLGTSSKHFKDWLQQDYYFGEFNVCYSLEQVYSSSEKDWWDLDQKKLSCITHILQTQTKLCPSCPSFVFSCCVSSYITAHFLAFLFLFSLFWMPAWITLDFSACVGLFCDSYFSPPTTHRHNLFSLINIFLECISSAWNACIQAWDIFLDFVAEITACCANSTVAWKGERRSPDKNNKKKKNQNSNPFEAWTAVEYF